MTCRMRVGEVPVGVGLCMEGSRKGAVAKLQRGFADVDAAEVQADAATRARRRHEGLLRILQEECMV